MPLWKRLHTLSVKSYMTKLQYLNSTWILIHPKFMGFGFLHLHLIFKIKVQRRTEKQGTEEYFLSSQVNCLKEWSFPFFCQFTINVRKQSNLHLKKKKTHLFDIYQGKMKRHMWGTKLKCQSEFSCQTARENPDHTSYKKGLTIK